MRGSAAGGTLAFLFFFSCILKGWGTRKETGSDQPTRITGTWSEVPTRARTFVRQPSASWSPWTPVQRADFESSYVGSWSPEEHSAMTRSWSLGVGQSFPDPPRWIYPTTFFLGAALTMPWFTINGAVKAFVVILGKKCYMLAQAAYYGPQLIVLIVQTACDYKLDAALGLRGAFVCRATLSFLFIAIAIIWLAFLNVTLPLLLGISFTVGTFQAIGLGGICQLAARFSPYAVITFQIGYGFAPVLVILSCAATGFQRQLPMSASNLSFYGIAAVLPLVGWLVTLLVLFSRAAQPFLTSPPSVALLGQDVASHGDVEGVTAILRYCWQSVVASYLNFTMGLLVLCLLPYIKGPSWMCQTIVFVNLSSNVVGRAISLYPPALTKLACTPARNLKTMLARLAFAVPFLLYILGALPEMDYVAVVYVGLIAMTAGFISSSVYSSACRATPKASQPRATLLVNAAMLAGIYTAVCMSITMDGLGLISS